MKVISSSWNRYIGGQLWAGGWYWGGAYTSFFREVCQLDLTPEVWRRGIAYEETIQSACWWWPHKDFLIVCGRPSEIHRELTNPNHPRGFGSHRLHNEAGAAVKWPDGWGVYAVHGVRLPAYIIEHPEQITVERIAAESNAEIRRIMITRYGIPRYMKDSGAELVHELPNNYFVKGLAGARLFRQLRSGDSDLVVCQVRNSTPEPDGSIKPYFLRIDPRAYAGEAARNCHAAIASTFRLPDDHKAFAYPDWRKYAPLFES